MTTPTYRSLGKEQRTEPPKIQGSRHIATAAPVQSAEEALEFVARVKREFHGANHTAWAYRVGRNGEDFRYSDDGEPSGSAGMPILKRIDGAGVTFVCVAVTRYFGGTKLGVGGLVRAYGGAAAAALDEAEIVEVTPKLCVTMRHGYEHSAAVASVLNATGHTPTASDYGDEVRLEFEVPEGDVDAFVQRLVDATAGQAQVAVERGEDS